MPRLRLRLWRARREDRGAVATIVAIVLGGGVLLGMGALAVDVGQIYAERAQLQNGADAGALAVAQGCAKGSSTCDPTTTGTASTYASRNANDGTSTVTLVCGKDSDGKLPACPPSTLQRYRLTPPQAAQPGQTHSSVVRTALSWTDRAVAARGLQQTVALELDRGGVNLRVQEWMLLRGVASALLAAVLVMLTGSALIGIPVGIAVGWLGSRLYLAIKAARRCAAFAAQLPDVLQLVASSLRSGFSLAQALESVVRDGSQPVAGEIGRALAASRLGIDLESSLDAVAHRMRSRDLAWTVMAIRIQREVGGNLAEVLVTTVQTMREWVRISRQVKALTAEGRLSAYILIGLPLVLDMWLFLARGDYERPLYTDPLGIAMLSVGGLLMVLGSFWLTRLVKVEV